MDITYEAAVASCACNDDPVNKSVAQAVQTFFFNGMIVFGMA